MNNYDRYFLEEALVDAFPLFDFANKDGSDDISDMITEGVGMLSDAIDNHLEFQSYGHPSASDLQDSRESDEIRRLKAEIEDLRKEIGVYQSSVKTRRNAGRVWVEGNSVMYEP